MNTCTLLGTVSDYGVTVRPLPESSTLQGTFSLLVSEAGPDGRVYTTYIPVEVYGRVLAQAEGLEPGMLVALQGKLKKRARTTRQGEQIYDLARLHQGQEVRS